MTSTERGETRPQRRERERAERAEWDYLIGRLGVLWPSYDCFCGTLDDLRRTVADLERRAARARPPRADARAATPGRAVDPTTHAKLATARAVGRVAQYPDAAVAHRQQLERSAAARARTVDASDADASDVDAD